MKHTTWNQWSPSVFLAIVAVVAIHFGITDGAERAN